MLHNDGDPLLITQHLDNRIYGIGVSTHADYFDGDKMQWLKDHAHMIDWTGFERLREEVLAYDPDNLPCEQQRAHQGDAVLFWAPTQKPH